MIDRLLSPALTTPHLVYSEARLDDAWRRLRASGADRILFAMKSCYRPPVLRRLRELGGGVEVMSPLEYELARRCGFSPADILVNGIGRSPGFLARVADDGCRIVVDTKHEFDLLCSLKQPLRLGVRVAPELPPQAAYSRPSKLGLTVGSAEFEAILAHCDGRRDLQLDLLHLHITSQQTRAGLYLETLNRLPLERFGIIDLGGGWETARDVAPQQFSTLGEEFRKRFPGKQLWMEPGRALANGAGFVVTTVRAIKESRGRGYLVMDAPTSTLMPHKEATYRLVHPEPGDGFHFDLVDGITSLTSVIKTEVGFRDRPQPGDRLVLENCGAYTSAMAQFWAFPPIPISYLDSHGALRPDLTPERIALAREALFGEALPHLGDHVAEHVW